MADEDKTITTPDKKDTTTVTPDKTVVPEDKKTIDRTLKDDIAGKSEAELVQKVEELSKKLGEQGVEVNQARDLTTKINVLLAAIGKDPAREQLVKTWLEEVDKANKGIKDENKDKAPVETRDNDAHKVLEDQIVADFEHKYGMDKLQGDARKEANVAIGQALWRLADPKQEYKTYDEMMKNIPLRSLDRMLDDAYFLANKDKILSEKGKKTEVVQGYVGRMASTGTENEETELTPEQLTVAAKMKIKPEVYLQRLKEINKK